MDELMNTNTDTSRNTDIEKNNNKVYSVHSISNGNISAPIILEQNNNIIQDLSLIHI